MANDEGLTIDTLEQLQHFFADAVPGSKSAYHGAQLEIFRMGGNAGLGVLLGIWYALFRRVSKEDMNAGLHLRVHFRSPSQDRIYAAMRSGATGPCQSFADKFQWLPAHDQAVKSFVTPDLEAAMLDLANKFNSVMLTDRYLSFGPLLGTPGESAGTVQEFMTKASTFFAPPHAADSQS